MNANAGFRIKLVCIPSALHERCRFKCYLFTSSFTYFITQIGVEIEALAGASIAALTIIDMTKAVSHDIRIEETRLIAKSGGKRNVGNVESL